MSITLFSSLFVIWVPYELNSLMGIFLWSGFQPCCPRLPNTFGYPFGVGVQGERVPELFLHDLFVVHVAGVQQSLARAGGLTTSPFNRVRNSP